MDIYSTLRQALSEEIEKHGLTGKKIHILLKALSTREAIGSPEHDDYPIVKGKEVMVEADFMGAKGQAFTDAFEDMDCPVEDLGNLDLNTNSRRAAFVAGLNAVYKHLGYTDKTVHCKDGEPVECARHLPHALGAYSKVLIVGHQPRFIETLASRYDVRAVDMDPDNIGKKTAGILIEAPEMTEEAMKWCDLIFATGSTLVNGTIVRFLEQEKPVLFYGVTIAAAARILNLDIYCHCGH